MGWNKEDKWYSGQGVVLLAPRDANGQPAGYEEVGNCSSVKLSIATTTIDKKEAKTGQRAIAKRLTTETKVTLSVSMDSYFADNLARALRGKKTIIPGASVVAEAVKGYVGKISSLRNIKVSAVAVKNGASALVAYVDDVTPYDYKINTEAGSIQLNDGAKIGTTAALGTAITGITVGATTSIAIVNTLAAGDTLGPITGVTGADAADLNGKSFTVVSATGAAAVIALNSTAKVYTITGTPKALLPTVALLVDYTFADQIQVDALTSAPEELFLRFEGLNTADSNEPVVVEVFRFNSDPLKDLDLISDTFQAFVLEGPALQDSLRPVGSNFFKVTKTGSKTA